jgi:hypothetical protein
MANEVMAGLFGVTPEGLAAQREQALQKQALTFAQLDPAAQVQYQMFLGGNRLGGAIGGMLGAQDPELARVTQRQQLLQGVNPSDAASLREAASRALAAGDNQAAAMLGQRAMDVEMAGAKLDAEKALATQRGRERASADPVAQFLRSNADKFTPESMKKFADSGDYGDLERITPADKFAKPAADWVAKAVELGFGDKARLGDYTPEQAKAVNSALLDESLKSRSAGAPKTTVSVNQKGEEAFAKQLGELDAKKVAAAVEARDNAATTLNSLSRLSALNDQGLISGTFATGRVGVTNLLNTLGLASPADAAKLAASENYQKTAGDVILGTLGGKLGAGFSNDDRKFIQGLVPQLENSPTARRQLIDFMAKKNTEIFNEAQRLEDYARKNNGLGGFKAKLPIVSPAPAAQMSADELAKAAGGRIVNGKFVPNAK